MEKLPLTMLHDLQQMPAAPLPDGYHFRNFGHDGDERIWAEIVTATGEFPSEQAALQRFDTEFVPHLSEAKKRIIFLETASNQAVGTATAWFDTWENIEIGRLHWVEIIPAYQGKKLGRPLIAKAMNCLATHHASAFLKTQTTSQAAIHLYKKFGWRPAVTSEQDRYAWKQVQSS